MKNVYRSIHIGEIFMPYELDEPRMIEVARRVADMGFYHGLELCPFLKKESHRALRELHESTGMPLMLWGAPLIWREQLNLSSLDRQLRERSIKRAIDLVNILVEIDGSYLGLPPGDDPGDALREDAKKALADSYARVADVAGQYKKALVLEPLDRYVHKKQLIGPMRESVEWFAPLHAAHPNIYLHWDSAHEALGEIDLSESLHLAAPYLAQLHLCNCITDKSHPMFGDWHMDVGQPPDFATEGYLTPEIGAKILKEVAALEPVQGVPFTHVSIEMRSHIGDDLWHKEKTARMFLARCFELAGLR